MHEGKERRTGPELAQLLPRRLIRVALTANAVGALFVALILFGFFFTDERGDLLHLDFAVWLFAGYLIAGVALVLKWSARRRAFLWGWLADGRPAEPGERDMVLREPLRAAAGAALLWSGAALVLGVVEAVEHSLHEGFDAALTVTLAGLTTSGITFLLAERVLRPAVARALAERPPEVSVGPGVEARLVVIWLLSSGVPLLAAGLLGAVALWLDEFTRAEIASVVLLLGIAGIVAGLGSARLVATSLGHSLANVRTALTRVRRGEFDARVEIDDGSEVGLLQAGFNEMAAGLGERERVRDLFGRHVGEEVARAALDRGTVMGGEARAVAALFVDIQGSTALAATRPPKEVVALLNRFFSVVVAVVDEHGGWVNKFEGDAALCVFGAPVEQPDYASHALAAARELHERLQREVPELTAGIGASAGPVVAGNVGSEKRYEYTVIGDPVNEAARLCDVAKTRAERVLVSGELLARASRAEAGRWRARGSTTLRGRSSATQLAEPIAGG